MECDWFFSIIHGDWYNPINLHKLVRFHVFQQAKGHELHFSMVEGDFKKFEGKWSVKAIPR